MERSSLICLMISLQIPTPSQVCPTGSRYGQVHCLKSASLEGQSNEWKNTVCHLTKSQLSSTPFQCYFNAYPKPDLTKVLHAGTRIQAKTGKNREIKQILQVFRNSIAGQKASCSSLRSLIWHRLMRRLPKLTALPCARVPTFKGSVATLGKDVVLFWPLKDGLGMSLKQMPSSVQSILFFYLIPCFTASCNYEVM